MRLAVGILLLLVAGVGQQPSPIAHSSSATPKTRPLLTYTEYGTYFCEANGAVDLAIYHDGTVLSMLKSPCGTAFRRDSTEVHRYRFSQERIRGILRRLKSFGIFDRPSYGHESPTDGNVVLLDAWFEGKRAISRSVYMPDETEPVGKANAYLTRLIEELPRDAPLYEPHGYVFKVSRNDHGGRRGAAWPERDRLDLRDWLGEHVVASRIGRIVAGLQPGFIYTSYRQDLRPDCDERACKRAFSVYWRPLWPHEAGP